MKAATSSKMTVYQSTPCHTP